MSEVTSDVSADSDVEGAPEYVGSIQPYMFEPTMTAEEANARLTAKRKSNSETVTADIQTWYVIQVPVNSSQSII